MQSTDLDVYKSQSDILKQIDLESIKGEFVTTAKWYKFFFKGILPTEKDSFILDIPCGHGNILTFLKQEGYTNVLGLDIDKGRVEIAQSLGLNAIIADGLKYLEEARDIDVIFSLDFLEHLEKEQLMKYLKNCYNSLKKDGLLIIRMPITDNLLGGYDYYNDFTHKWTAHSQVIAGVLKLAGFPEVIIKDERPLLYKWTNYIRYGFFKVLSNFHNIYLRLLGFPALHMWSRSAFFIAKKQ